jgi:NDP-sugar pyrophosphorylase family protein
LIDTCLERGEFVRAYQIADDWIDIGQEGQLRQARNGVQ